jgi:predicted DsbA family dithiol-disulfide isomerase
MKIDVFQDTVCPWCRIGKQHLKLALAKWDGEPVEVRYHTFFLNDQIPPEGYEFRSYMQNRYNGRVSPDTLFERPRQAGEQVGLEFNFDRIEYAPNSTLSHRLIALAPEEKKEAILDAIYAAYFQHGRNIGNLEELIEIAAEAGLDAEAIRGQLEGDAGLSEVLDDVQWAKEAGISGVPFFVINDRYAFSGAQPPATILRVLQQVAHETAEREVVGA